jgi:hypothetical protein
MRGRRLVLSSLATAAYLASASVASSASNPPARQGFWIGFGIGYGSAHATCDGCIAGKRESGGVGYLNLGGTLSDRLLAGVEVSGWSKEHEGVTLNLYNILGTLTIYPRPSSNFFLKFGGGLAFLDNDFKAGPTTITVDQGNGVALLAGAGYDIRVWTKASVTLGANFWYGQRFGSIVFGDPFTSTWKQNVVDVTLGITFH